MKYIHILLYRLYGRIPYKSSTGFTKYLNKQRAKNEALLRAKLFKFLIANHDKKS